MTFVENGLSSAEPSTDSVRIKPCVVHPRRLVAEVALDLLEERPRFVEPLLDVVEPRPILVEPAL